MYNIFCSCKGPEEPPETCDRDANRLAKAEEICAIIKKTDGPFAECIDVDDISADDYFDNCVIDVCVTEEARCDILMALAEECRAADVLPVNWRNETDCRKSLVFTVWSTQVKFLLNSPKSKKKLNMLISIIFLQHTEG